MLMKHILVSIRIKVLAGIMKASNPGFDAVPVAVSKERQCSPSIVFAVHSHRVTDAVDIFPQSTQTHMLSASSWNVSVTGQSGALDISSLLGKSHRSWFRERKRGLHASRSSQPKVQSPEQKTKSKQLLHGPQITSSLIKVP